MTRTPRDLAQRLLAWYDRHRRVLPWRALPGERPDPYRIWLSEIMLQQTTVAAVGPYYAGFLERWPTVADLAAAPLDDVLHAWQGLGYYARARNLHRAARAVAEAGGFPDTEESLRALPGIGAYTAAAVAAIAFGRRASAVDANGERVIARLFGVETPLPKAKGEIRKLAATLVPERRAGDYAQALMDLGATICTPRGPACVLCPWAIGCATHGDALPRRPAKKERPSRHGVVFWAERGDGSVLLRRRPENGLLGGMIEVPSTPWREERWTEGEARRAAPIPARWKPGKGAVEHGFTHFDITLGLMRTRVAADEDAPAGCFWWKLDRLHEQALPTLTKKVVALAVDGKRQRIRRS